LTDGGWESLLVCECQLLAVIDISEKIYYCQIWFEAREKNRGGKGMTISLNGRYFIFGANEPIGVELTRQMLDKQLRIVPVLGEQGQRGKFYNQVRVSERVLPHSSVFHCDVTVPGSFRNTANRLRVYGQNIAGFIYCVGASPEQDSQKQCTPLVSQPEEWFQRLCAINSSGLLQIYNALKPSIEEKGKIVVLGSEALYTDAPETCLGQNKLLENSLAMMREAAAHSIRQDAKSKVVVHWGNRTRDMTDQYVAQTLIEWLSRDEPITGMNPMKVPLVGRPSSARSRIENSILGGFVS
jgi:hypothetical protein